MFLNNITNAHSNLLEKLDLNRSTPGSSKNIILSIKLALRFRICKISQTNETLDAKSRNEHDESVAKDFIDEAIFFHDAAFQSLTYVILNRGSTCLLGIAVTDVNVLAYG